MSTSPEEDRRNYHRVPFSAEVIMQSGNEEWSCHLIDISLKGLLVSPPEGLDFDINKPCAVALFLGDSTSIHMRARVVHEESGRWGLEWDNIDIEGLTHLRRLLELNMNDAAEIDRELSELG